MVAAQAQMGRGQFFIGCSVPRSPTHLVCGEKHLCTNLFVTIHWRDYLSSCHALVAAWCLKNVASQKFQADPAGWPLGTDSHQPSDGGRERGRRGRRRRGEARDGRQRGGGEVRLKGVATAKLLAAHKLEAESKTCLTSRFLPNSHAYATLNLKRVSKKFFKITSFYFFLTVLHLSHHLLADSWFPEAKSSQANSVFLLIHLEKAPAWIESRLSRMWPDQSGWELRKRFSCGKKKQKTGSCSKLVNNGGKTYITLSAVARR